MIEYRFDVYGALNKEGLTVAKARKTGILSQSTMTKLKEGDTSISLDTINRICTILDMQPKDLIKYTATDEDRKILVQMNE